MCEEGECRKEGSMVGHTVGVLLPTPLFPYAGPCLLVKVRVIRLVRGTVE